MRAITGGSGFIGKHLKSDLKITRDVCDLTNREALVKLLESHKIGQIIHLAAKHGSSQTMSKNHLDYYATNGIIDLNVISSAARIGIPNLIAVSSISTLASSGKLELTEGDLERTNIPRINFGYNASKRIAIDLCEAVQLDYGFNYRSILLGNIYGPADYLHRNGTLVASIISQMIDASRRDQDLILFGTGQDRRTFTYVKDLEPVFDFILSASPGTPIIVSSNFQATVREVAEIVARVLNYRKKIIFADETNGTSTHKVSNDSSLRKMGFDASWTTLEEGIEQTIAWALQHE